MSAPVDRFRCQCRRWLGAECAARMTQEDLLCDNCREGCSLIGVDGGPQPPFHGRVTEFRWKVAPAGLPRNVTPPR